MGRVGEGMGGRGGVGGGFSIFFRKLVPGPRSWSSASGPAEFLVHGPEANLQKKM